MKLLKCGFKPCKIQQKAGKVSKPEKSLHIREKSPNKEKVSKSEKSLKIAKLIILIPSKPA